MTPFFRRFLLLAGCLLLAACTNTPRDRFYTLLPPMTAGQSAVPVHSTDTIVVGPVGVPDAIDRPQMVVRFGDTLNVLEQNRWVQSPRFEIGAALAHYLSRRLGVAVITAQQIAVSGSRYRIGLEVLRFDSEPGQAAGFDAIWIVRDSAGKTLASGRSTQRVPCRDGSYEAVAVAHSQAIDRLSGEIAAALAGLPVAGRRETQRP
ncbi:PqiC family protein [Chitinimonas lacunae]|uniref:Membrane integrity-associated transporter subunit PqiC n=1 Tax=Chitinimonas lacunae TaxID=1963018 RepID=A0ABV8MJP9_9NEIS